LNIYFLSFRNFEQLALALKTEFSLKIFKTGGRLPPDPPPRTPMAKTYERISKSINQEETYDKTLLFSEHQSKVLTTADLKVGVF